LFKQRPKKQHIVAGNNRALLAASGAVPLRGQGEQNGHGDEHNLDDPPEHGYVVDRRGGYVLDNIQSATGLIVTGSNVRSALPRAKRGCIEPCPYGFYPHPQDVGCFQTPE
jgi:hypothetical protein